MVLLKYVGMNPIVVHGGGPDITRYMERLGMEVSSSTACGCPTRPPSRWRRWSWSARRTRTSCCGINRHGQPAVGLCGDDGVLFTVRKQLAAAGADIGFVGQIEKVDADVLLHIAEDYIPVIASVGADSDGHSYNVNADAAAARGGRRRSRRTRSIFLTDVEGWLADDDPGQRSRRPRRPRCASACRR